MLPPRGSPTAGNNLISELKKSSMRKFQMNENNVARTKGPRSNGRVCFGTYTPTPKSHPNPRKLAHRSMASRSQNGKTATCEGCSMTLVLYDACATSPLSLAVKESFTSPGFTSPSFCLPSLDRPKSSPFATMICAQRPA